MVTLGVALSITVSSPEASPMPLLLVGILIILFLSLEARRYRYFSIWRSRARWLETHFYVPMLIDGNLHSKDQWHRVLAEDYGNSKHGVSYPVAIARRVHSNYLSILLIQSIADLGKLIVHPVPASDAAEFVQLAEIGPLLGEVVLLIGIAYIVFWISLAVWISSRDAARIRAGGGAETMG